MRIPKIAFFCILASLAHADGVTDIVGTNNAGEKFLIYNEEYDFGPSGSPKPPYWYYTISISKVGSKAKAKHEHQFCGHTSPTHFTCASGGSSPLSGVSYEDKGELKNCGGTLYVCKVGCNNKVPATLIKEVWECE